MRRDGSPSVPTRSEIKRLKKAFGQQIPSPGDVVEMDTFNVGLTQHVINNVVFTKHYFAIFYHRGWHQVGWETNPDYKIIGKAPIEELLTSEYANLRQIGLLRYRTEKSLSRIPKKLLKRFCDCWKRKKDGHSTSRSDTSNTRSDSENYNW